MFFDDIIKGNAVDATSRAASSRVSAYTPPSLINPLSGAGMDLDKSASSRFQSVILPRQAIEAAYTRSWAAGKFIDILVDDLFVRGRRYMGDDDSAIQTMTDAYDELDVDLKLRGSMKAGRLFGTGMLIIMSDNASPDTPLDPESVSEGSVSNLLVTDKDHVEIEQWVINPQKPRYGEPVMYRVTLRPRKAGSNQGERELKTQIDVHHTRVIRLDGISSPVSEGWWGVGIDPDWGVSELSRAMDEILRDESMHAGIGQLVQEASIFTIRAEGFKQAVKGRPMPGDPTMQEIAMNANMLKSMYRVMFLDKEDEAERIAVHFAGLPQLMDRQAMRLAAIADIPATRFLSQSPQGMNATGKSDSNNYGIRIASIQKNRLTRPYLLLDTVIGRNVGLREPLEHEWVPLTDISDHEQAETDKLTVEALTGAQMAAGLDENEIRERLSTLELFGELEPLSEEQILERNPPPIDPNAPPEDGGGGEGGNGNGSGAEA